MSTPQAPFELISRVCLLAKDPVFAHNLTELVEQHERQAISKRYIEEAVTRVVANPSGAHAQRLLQVRANGNYYNGYSLIPDEYEALERWGLVECEFGNIDASGCKRRTIHLTDKGREVAAQLRNTVHPDGTVSGRAVDCAR